MEELNIWSALEPLTSLVSGFKSDNEADDAARRKEEKQEESSRKRYRRRMEKLQAEVEQVNDEATETRKLLWESQDKVKGIEDQVRELENHLNEILELREKDLENIKLLRIANFECVENEGRANEAMEVFKKCYKRAQLKIKDHEEEIAVLREHKGRLERGTDKTKSSLNTATMVNESALEYIQMVSGDREKKLNQMLVETETKVDLWKSKYKVAHKRCLNWQEQILAMEHPSEGAAHIRRQGLQIDSLEAEIALLEKKLDDEEKRNPFDIMVRGTSCFNEGLREGLTKTFSDGFDHFSSNIGATISTIPTCPTEMPKYNV